MIWSIILSIELNNLIPLPLLNTFLYKIYKLVLISKYWNLHIMNIKDRILCIIVYKY